MGAKGAGSRQAGFTLIELAIVLVIIGLIVGGVLVGQSLIGAAAVRSQVTQIEQYNTAAATFYGKYGSLPGDISSAAANQFGLSSRAGSAGRGDSNGELDGFASSDGLARAYAFDGENLLFWEDLSTLHLIDQTFNAYTDGTTPTCTASQCVAYMPLAKLGNGNLIYAYSGYANNCPGNNCIASTGIGPNFFGISSLSIGSNSSVATAYGGSSIAAMTVAQAYAIDKKADDGLPTTGRILAQYTGSTGHPGWSANGATPSASTCYDTSSGMAAYSVNFQNGALVNCGISFQLQAGD